MYIYTGMYKVHSFIISYVRKSMKHVHDFMEALMQCRDKLKVVKSTSLEGKLDGIPSGTKLVSLLAMFMSGETSLAKSLMAIDPKDMMQHTNVRYIQVHCTCL